MNRKQWYTLGIGAFIFGMYMFSMTTPWSLCGNWEEYAVSCSIARYAYAIPALIFTMFGILFLICAWLEK